jgi:MoxR-like ATPase
MTSTDIPALARRVIQQVQKVVVGKETQTRLMLTAILAQGHILLDDLPGVGKTTLVKTLAIALGCDFKRIQFTPDLLPSDVVGMNVYDQRADAFRRLDGPVVTNLLLADEINRAIPRTQSALLEAMEERQVTIDGETTPLPAPFVVMATQNPVEFESTFRLPAAQLDRFFLRLSLGYPDPAEEARMLRGVGDAIPFDRVEPVTSARELADLQRQVQAVTAAECVVDYLVALVSATRSHPLLRMGASPRGSRALYRGSKALAALSGRDFITPDDVKELAVPVLAHRLVLSNEARLAGQDAAAIIRELLDTVPVPPSRQELLHGPA